MIVQSIRLKNIRSYGEGPDGNGITVAFQPGVNRIAGKNGHGKTTLIESLGYALFLTRPPFEETFDIATYFLRAGKRAGEIDATFSHCGDAYRIERGLGSQSKRRSKAVQLSDGSTCAEGDEEVSRFLCRLLEFPCEENLREIFSKLAGVKQGRLTWPFDSKPGEAKRFFEPLLDVAVFRECFDRLKPAVERFEGMRHEQEKKLAGIDERVRERAGSGCGVEAKRMEVADMDGQLAKLNESREAAVRTRAHLESREESVNQAERLWEGARNSLVLASQRHADATKRFHESQGASTTIAQAAPSYEAHERAAAALKDLRVAQAKQAKLEKERVEAARRKDSLDGKAHSAESQATIFEQQRAVKDAESVLLQKRLAPLSKEMEDGAKGFEERKAAAGQASEDRSEVRHFVAGLAQQVNRLEKCLSGVAELTGELTAWNPSAVQTAQEAEARSDEAVKKLRAEIAGLKERHRSLAGQLGEIRGGACPFLKEQCRQFDASKVGSDLERLSLAGQAAQRHLESSEATCTAAKVERTRLQLQEAALGQKRVQLQGSTREFIDIIGRILPASLPRALGRLGEWVDMTRMPAPPQAPPEGGGLVPLRECHRGVLAFAEDVRAWWQKADVLLQAKQAAFDQEEKWRIAARQNVINLLAEGARLSEEIQKSAADEKKQRDAALALRSQSAEVAKQAMALEEQLRSFASVAEDIAREERVQQDHRAGFQRYLGAKPLADQLCARQADTQLAKDAVTAAAAALQLADSARKGAKAGFDPQALAAARRDCEEKTAEAVKQAANLANAKLELQREEKRFAEWMEACSERETVSREIDRLRAAADLANMAREVLKNSAPAVAQHLCTRIGAHAQRIFNKINHDPVELEWKAEPRYSLSVQPGDRRFAMLSGGEQTKLALAMTLAMIQEFSNLKFCIFDEPTYGVDADSREKLADAILEAQTAAGLEQLLLVSHDDAFHGKIEHAILLRKTAAHGTEVVLL